jgi:hypothetical protein
MSNAKIYRPYHMKESKMVRVCSTHWIHENIFKILTGKPLETSQKT